ncbi:MAG: NAD(P)H-quinone oxidoreductase [Candidatus Obscuribacterales bacterium]|nr:NAD(P)H-quinone oxidoreductase [Candidatus Obscuribacterales bacterium]
MNSETMQAIVITQPGGPEVLTIREVERPEPSHNEVLIKIHAAAVNRADLIQRAGHYPPPRDVSQVTPGLEFAGEIVKIGKDVFDCMIGERIFGLVGGGAYAQYLTAHPRTLSRIPQQLSYEEASALPEACITAWDAMVSQGQLQTGESILINGVTSGVGTIAVQIAHALNCFVVGTTRSSSKSEKLKQLGLDNVIISEKVEFADKVKAFTAKKGVDVVLELIGGDYLGEDLLCTAQNGRIILVGLIGGAKTNVDLSKVLMKRIKLIGTSLRARPLEEKIAVAQTFSKSVVPLIAQGKIVPVVDATYDLRDAGRAHEHLAQNSTFGKIILRVSH